MQEVINATTYIAAQINVLLHHMLKSFNKGNFLYNHKNKPLLNATMHHIDSFNYFNLLFCMVKRYLLP